MVSLTDRVLLCRTVQHCVRGSAVDSTSGGGDERVQTDYVQRGELLFPPCLATQQRPSGVLWIPPGRLLL